MLDTPPSTRVGGLSDDDGSPQAVRPLVGSRLRSDATRSITCVCWKSEGSKTARMRGLLYGLAMVAVAGCASSFNSLQRAHPASTPAPLAIEQRLILIGDAGTVESAGVLQVMADSIRNLADITTVVFLGDNVYPDGVPSDTASYRSAAEDVLRQQVVAGTTEGATAIFVAGNHDWKHALPGIIAQAELVSQFGGPQARFLPQPPGCPGPGSVALGERVLLVTLDTEWMLMEDKPAGPCANRTNQEVLQDQVMLASRGSRDVVIAAHHPLRTKGVHGGKCGVLCLRQIWKSIVGDEQDLRHARNREMRNGIADAIRSARPVVYAAGHDHSMQVFEGAEGSEAAFFLVSGRGTADTHGLVGHDESTLYAAEGPGFMILDFLSQDRVLLRVIETETGDVYVRALR